MAKNSDKLLKIYIVILLYSSLLKIIFGRWVTIISDVALLALLLNYIRYSAGRIKTRNGDKIYWILVATIQIIALLEVFHPNINNVLYSVIEYRKSYFQMIAFLVFLIYLKYSKLKINEWLKFIGYFGIPIALYGIKQFIYWSRIDNIFAEMNDSSFWTLHYGGHMRSVSIFSGPFHYGMFCVLLFSVFLYLFISDRKKRYLFWAIVAAVGCYCSITRTNFVCLIVAFLVWIFEFYISDCRKNSRALKVCFIVFALMMCALLVLEVIPVQTDGNMLAKMLNSIMNISQDSRLMQRTTTWQQAITYIAKSPLFGWGMGTAGDTLSKYNISNVYVTSHSMYLKVWMETGIIGGFLYIILPIWIVCSTRKIFNYRLRTLLYNVVLCILLNGLVGSTIATFPSITLFWIIMALLVNEKTKILDRKDVGV